MIDVHSLEYSYPIKAAVETSSTICNISFSVAPGEIFGFLGPSGSGKSTTQKLLCGLLSGYKGEINIGGRALSQWSRDYYKFIGVGFEMPNHFNKLSAIENLQLFASFYDAPTLDPYVLLERLSLADAAKKPVESFSKGMKMRLNFARCLLHKPQLIFLDEPTAGLDPINARIVKELILEQKANGHTIFLTTHIMQDVDELCDRIALIDQGKIVALDTPKALKHKYGRPLVEVHYSDTTNPELLVARFDIHTLSNNEQFLGIVKGCHIVSIHSQEASLEEVFIKTTGRAAL